MRASAFRTTVKTVLMCSVAWGFACPALAQTEAPAAAAEQADDPREGGLAEVIVTARKRAENLQNIPVAETVVTKAQIENLGINSVEKLAVLAPQLVIGRNGSGNGASIGLRGVSVAATSISLEQSVAVVVDGVYYSGGRALNVGMFDLQQAEVLKGPQSLFYGKNTTAGAVSFTTADPTKSFEGMVRAGYEFRGQNPFIEGFVSGPVSESLSLRLAARYSKQYEALIENVSAGATTYTRDIATGITTTHTYPAARSHGERNMIVRGALKFDNDGPITATAKLTFNQYDSATPNSAAVIGRCDALGVVQTQATAPCGSVFKQIQGAIPRDIAATLPFKAGNGENFLDFRSVNGTVNLRYENDDITLDLVPAYTTQRTYWTGDFDFTDVYLSRSPTVGGSGGNNANTYESQKAFSLEARAQTRFENGFNVMVGGYYQDSDLIFRQANIFPGGIENSAVTNPAYRYLTVFKDGHTFGKTYAAFGQVLIDLSSQVNFTAGARYTHETKDQKFSQPYVFPGSLATFAVRTYLTDQTFNNFSPEATLAYKPSRNVTAYVSYKTGYKSGGLSISGTIAPLTTLDDAAFGNEKVRGIEGGIKTTLADNQLRINFDAFHYKYTGLQVDYFDPLIIRYLTLNAGSLRTQGAEVDMQYAPRAVPGLLLRGSAAYTDAKYSSFASAPCVGGQTPAEGCNLGLNPATGGFTAQSLSGQRAPQAPKFTATASIDYTTDVSTDLQFGASLNGRYSSRYKFYAFAPDSADRFYQSSYATLDASLRLFSENKGWELALLAKNLTNKFIVSTGFDLTYTGGRAGFTNGVHSDTRTSVYDPRTVALQGTFRF